ncbi:hypothetical protein J7E25_16145 [Agromyces sp. ISL-38]|uniref:hypothetical protein n=1 Tax=Agromyces sp. ISL-38 TaxID=2819107 RepID=UPI001BE9582C|nr:hypothetical protein [Agromyces sp. ISL-38]MBT2500629.1 hypothetical protein [Agromyces sp. ISL-38]
MPETDENSSPGSMRPRGRHAAPSVSPMTTAHPLSARAVALVGAVIEWGSPRVSAIAAWVMRHPRSVFAGVVGVTVVAALGGTLALLQSTNPVPPEGSASSIVDQPRPTSTQAPTPAPFGPILPTPKPPSSSPPPTTPAPEPGDEVPAVGDGTVAEPTPSPTEAGHPSDNAPGASNRPDKGKG